MKKNREIFFEEEKDNGKAEKVVFVAVIIGIILVCMVSMAMMAEGIKDGSGKQEGLTFGVILITFIVVSYLAAKFCDRKNKGR